ncbi:MAG TPA: FoF1 ATP synthase subunit gamma [Candidatus Babeliales bacterium]|nr:FoF1 ATP synthase subunit gamma [Candidatus Babeliales bacterium]
MAQLIQMRQRIHAIETIKKITYAMRLISMSTHSQLKNKEKPLTFYTNALNQLFVAIKDQASTWHNPLMHTTEAIKQKTLVIIVGSQKGLCGNFNTALLKFFHTAHPSPQTEHNAYIAIGKKMIELLASHDSTPLLLSFPEFSTVNITALATRLINHIITEQYTQVTIISNRPRSFFLQKPEQFQLVPFTIPPSTTNTPSFTQYSWEQKPEVLLDIVLHQYIEATIYEVLFQSLVAEQAARFLSMDGSTRNANGLLETAKLQYNKFRQAKITRELTELTSSM